MIAAHRHEMRAAFNNARRLGLDHRVAASPEIASGKRAIAVINRRQPFERSSVTDIAVAIENRAGPTDRGRPKPRARRFDTERSKGTPQITTSAPARFFV